MTPPPRRRVRPPPAAGLLALLGLAAATPGCAGSRPEAIPPREEGSPPADARGPFAPPSRLPGGDRWFVGVRPGEGPEPFVARTHRLPGPGGLLVEEVTWGPSFQAVATARHGVMQRYALVLDGRGLGIDLLDERGRPLGTPILEVAAPYAPGTEWVATDGPARDLVGRVVGVEAVETPGGRIEGTLRVEVRSLRPGRSSQVTWYDAGLRPVRGLVRDGDGRLLEARAALPDGDPSPAQAAAALTWARRHLP